MTLHYLSGDDTEIGKSKKRKEKKEKRKEKKAKKKEDGKNKPKKIAKIGLAPVRGAFLTVTSLNLLKTGTKLARVWNKTGGKDALLTWWRKMGGDSDKLKKAISKGSKQTVSGDDMGIAIEIVLATATAALIAVAPLIKKFGAQGNDEEAKEYDEGIEKGKHTLATDPDFEKSVASMPEDADVALVKPGKVKDDDGATPLGLHTNPVTICFFMLIMIAGMKLENPILQLLSVPFSLYAMIGFVVIPFSEFGIAGEKIKTVTRKYFDIPSGWFGFNRKNIFSDGKA
jgi:hypothetical protein